MDLSGLIKAVSNAAPIIGGALGGPAGTAIGAAIASKFGGDINNPEKLATLIASDPEAKIKLAELENQLTLSLRQAETEDFKTEVDDKKSARQRAVEFAKVGVRDYTQEIIAVITVLSGFCMLGIYSLTPQVESKEITLGIVAILTQVYSYYFGSSRGERRAMERY